MFSDFLIALASFALIILASREIGKQSIYVGVPLISGFILTGVLAGPYVLGLLTAEVARELQLIDGFALPFIALAAGAEINFRQLKSSLRRILTILSCIIATVVLIGSTGILLLREFIPFTHNFRFQELIAVAFLGSTILAAKSPSSTIAVVKELRAKGPFTQTVLGVTIVMDAVVIMLFTFGCAIADMIFKGTAISVSLFIFLIFEILLNCLGGIFVGWLIKLVLSMRMNSMVKGLFILAIGHATFSLSQFMHNSRIVGFPIEVFSEPLLVCMLAGLVVSNFSKFRAEFHNFIEETAPVVFILFFTAVGVGLELGVIREALWAVLALILLRLLGMYLGCFLGNSIAAGNKLHSKYLGFCFVTQAGISLSLAKDVQANFPGWGADFAALLVSIIVINTLIGPAFFKFALTRIGESNLPGQNRKNQDDRAVIFGIDNQALALAMQLQSNGWQVSVANFSEGPITQVPGTDLEIQVLSDISREALESAGVGQAETVVVMLDNETNYKICELIHSQFNCPHIVAFLRDRFDAKRFYDLGVLIVDPATAIVNLLDHFVRSPSAARLLLGQEKNKDVVEFEVKSPGLHGLALRDLSLPQDCLILAIRRKGSLVLSHGYTRLRIGDEVTVVGSRSSLRETALVLEV